MSLQYINVSRLTGLSCSKVPSFWMVEHQLVVNKYHTYIANCCYLCSTRAVASKFGVVRPMQAFVWNMIR